MSSMYPKHIDLSLTSDMKASLEATRDVTGHTEVQLIRDAINAYLQPVYAKALADREQERKFVEYVAESKPDYNA